MLNKLLILAAFLGVLCAPAWAGITPNSFTLSPMVGGQIFDADQPLKDAMMASIGLGYNLSKIAALEAVYTQADANGDTAAASGSKVRTYRLDALYHFMPEQNLVPYFGVGFGGIHSNPKSGKSSHHFMANYGFGIKYFLDQWVALRADVRHLLDFPEPENNLLYSAGLLIQFGTPEAAPEPVATPPAGEPTPLDSDGDGINDDMDRCPGTPAGAPVNSIGCPIDTDGDGIADYLDQCPDTPRGAPVDTSGCPLDSDGDGVFDYRDSCPATAAGVSVDENGCPSKLTLRINFRPDSNLIGEQYLGEIAKAAKCINQFPGNLVYIDGHTDSQGSADYNQKLSERRATAVVKSLVDQFDIAASRLTARGFGESQPIADNTTNEGRAENRRVEVACGATE